MKQATEYFSRADCSSLPFVIVAMDKLDEQLTTISVTQTLEPAIRAAAGLAKRTLNRYYSLTDQADAYRVSMVLHPRRKLEYFQEAGWASEWIAEAEALTRRLYDAKYASKVIVETQEVVPKAKSSRNMFDNLAANAPLKHSDRRDELERYLRAPIEDADDPIQWWKDRQALYPKLSQMAIDYLVIPPTSVDVERLFSKGRLILSHVRSRLSVQTTRALLCLNSWVKHGFIKTSDLESVSRLPEIREGEDEPDLEDGWDSITRRSV